MAVMEGSLSKWTNVMKGWQYRWFVLDENSGLLSYYTSKEKMMRGVRRGCVRLKGAVIGIDDEDDSTFTITVDHKTFHFQARDGEEREKWVRALEDTIFRHGNRVRWDSSGSQPTIKDFDNKVAEADAYLQLMIEQTNKLEIRIQNAEDLEEKTKYQVIFEHANAMLDDIKHSIVLLQIAKNTAHPVNGIYPLSCLQSTDGASFAGTPVVLSVPEMSYSSSEGEDDFFDANDSPFNTGSQVATPTSLRQFSNDEQAPAAIIRSSAVISATAATSACTTATSATVLSTTDGGEEQNHLESRASLTIITDPEHFDYDSLYDDDVESDVQMDSQGSVIRHLLSQVKIGMDLTKVVLPTFILERRSLLEMYADYFAHPDIFVKIADLATPRERMVQVVRWYLSSYHAGRKSAVAKKPYNPILGETFCCHWDIPPVTKLTPNQNQPPVNDGPVPWCKQNQLSFVAEQVSHHPPISAFYAEHYTKRITFNAHIYTKSKFLGLSICVYNLGQGTVSLLEHDEHYTVTFPNGYGRSILTVPWIELGGTVTITCPATGYCANVEFQTKPFYGNRRHKVVADVYAPEEPKKPFLTVNGEWNGLMEAKWADKEPEEFIDVNKLDIVQKQVRPISQQGESESRKLWKDVTVGLKINNIERATKAKATLEQKQRNSAKERKEKNIEWDTKLFTKGNEEGGWYYLKPLQQRLSHPQASNT